MRAATGSAEDAGERTRLLRGISCRGWAGNLRRIRRTDLEFVSGRLRVLCRSAGGGLRPFNRGHSGGEAAILPRSYPVDARSGVLRTRCHGSDRRARGEQMSKMGGLAK